MNPGSTIRGIQALASDATTQVILAKNEITVVRNALTRRVERRKEEGNTADAEFMQQLADGLQNALTALNDLDDRQ